jgi:GAF domain-containing protein
VTSDQPADKGASPPADEAQATIARQAAEIEGLRKQLEGERFAGDLREALTLAATAGTIGSPVTHARLLEMIVETAAHVISARSAALFLLDEEAHALVFEVALGSKAEEVKKFRLPLGHGIAGLVAVSGQPMAISDAESDPRLAADIAESVGYLPQSVLCMPLFYGDRVIGVIELLDKEGRASFDAADMEALGLFANQAAVALQQSRTHQNLAALVRDILGSADSGKGAGFAALVEEDAAFRESLELARLVHEIVNQGESESEACRSMLRGFAEYLRLRPRAGSDLSPLR